MTLAIKLHTRLRIIDENDLVDHDDTRRPMAEVNVNVDENVCYEFPLRCNENEMIDN